MTDATLTEHERAERVAQVQVEARGYFAGAFDPTQLFDVDALFDDPDLLDVE